MSKSILIVEDESMLRQVFSTLFTLEHFIVHQASNGKEAIDLLQSQNEAPDVIILDLLMPVMGGIEFLETVDVKKNLPQTKVLVLSNLSDQKTLQTIQSLGAERYLLKAGVSPRELVQAVNEIL